MLRRVRRIVEVVLLLSTLLTHAAAEQDGSHPAPIVNRAQFFSGFVTEIHEGSIRVIRRASPKEIEQRVFLIDGQTKVEGDLHVNARVTVRFVSTENGERAVRIIVR